MDKNKPEIVLLTKSNPKKNKKSNVIEYIQLQESPTIPLNLLDSIFISLLNGEKYKISKTAIKHDIEIESLSRVLEGLGVPEDISTIEIVLDIEEAEKVIRAETANILDKVFSK